MPLSHFNLLSIETYLSVFEILIKKNEKVSITMENC